MLHSAARSPAPLSVVCRSCSRVTVAKIVSVEKSFDVGLSEPLVVEIRTTMCTSCGRLTEPRGLDEAARSAATMAVIDGGLANGSTFRLMRNALGLNAKEVAALLSAGVGTVSRWENARRQTDRRAWALLACLALEAEGHSHVVTRVLEAMASPRPTTRVCLSTIEGVPSHPARFDSAS